jgi:hypothetical protein
MKLLRTFLTLALAAAGILGSTSIATAGLLQLEITRTGGPTIVAVDNDANDGDPTLNSIKILEATWGGVFGELNSGTSFVANSNQGDPLATFSQLTVNTLLTLDVGYLGGLTEYTILASQTGFIKPVSNSKVTQTTGSNTFLNNNANNTTDYQGWVNTADVLFGFGPVSPGLHGTWSLTTSVLPTSDPDEPVLGPLFFNSPNPYSLTGRIRTSLTAGAQITTAGTIAVAGGPPVPGNPIPEPATMGVVGMGLAALYFVRRKK